MPYRVEIAPSATEDIEAAYLWIRRRSPAVAAVWFNGLDHAVASLEENPRRCSLAPEADAFLEEIRQLLYGKRRHVYRILFTVVGRTVRVLHVRHAARPTLRP
ncbi:MAG: type II toxin-antitoxin system RelE/ParE family toxin [Candidatus Rokubacteria bacterium]|nr:type II toxin-antitoxin system RelE/ParE family toxin [Candidatus Rokubacteria bacterium]